MACSFLVVVLRQHLLLRGAGSSRSCTSGNRRQRGPRALPRFLPVPKKQHLLMSTLEKTSSCFLGRRAFHMRPAASPRSPRWCQWGTPESARQWQGMDLNTNVTTKHRRRPWRMPLKDVRNHNQARKSHNTLEVPVVTRTISPRLGVHTTNTFIVFVHLSCFYLVPVIVLDRQFVILRPTNI